ncbi:MAG: hypothetical protein JWM91_5488, partial [Rhodospirillales bacterium]|nr:hypothetical protein [Rhodospirillales bacterium]
RVALNLELNQLEVPLAAAVDQVDRAPPIARTRDQARRNRYLVRPVSSSKPIACGGDRALYNYFGAPVMHGNLRLKALPAPVFARSIFIGGSAAAPIVAFDRPMYRLNQHRSIECGNASGENLRLGTRREWGETTLCEPSAIDATALVATGEAPHRVPFAARLAGRTRKGARTASVPTPDRPADST